MAKVIAIVNQKGGVGKTTTTINVGVGIAQHSKSVLLIDMDSQGNLSSGLGCKVRRGQHTIRDTLLSAGNGAMTNPFKGIVSNREEHLDIMPANKQLFAFERSIKDNGDAPFLLERFVNGVRGRYEYILIDCSPSLGVLTQNALVAADSVIIPVDPEFFGLEGVKVITDTMKLVKKGMNPDLYLEGIVIVRRNNVSIVKRTNVEQLRQRYGDKVFRTELPSSVKASEAAACGMSLLRYQRWNHLARAYASLVEEVLANERQ